MDDATGATGSWPNAATLVLQADTPEQRVWAARTAVGLVRKQAARRTKVILIDLYPSDSPLEEAIGVGGGRGIVDVLVRERSFSDVARRPDGDGYYFVPHGGGARTVAELFDHPQWPKIADRLPGAGAYMFPCVSADAWLRAGPIRGFEPSILINGSGAEIELPGGARQVLELLAPPEVREGGPVQAPDPRRRRGGRARVDAREPGGFCPDAAGEAAGRGVRPRHRRVRGWTRRLRRRGDLHRQRPATRGLADRGRRRPGAERRRLGGDTRDPGRAAAGGGGVRTRGPRRERVAGVPRVPGVAHVRRRTAAPVLGDDRVL